MQSNGRSDGGAMGSTTQVLIGMFEHCGREKATIGNNSDNPGRSYTFISFFLATVATEPLGFGIMVRTH